MSPASPAVAASAIDLQQLADRLETARRGRRTMPPLRHAEPPITLADAYAVQQLTIERRVAEGATQVGHKVGLTSRAMQDMLGVDEPDFGVVLDDMVVADAHTVGLASLIQPRVEAEIAFIMGEDLRGPAVTPRDARAAVRGALPALEIIDSRIANWDIGLVDTIADNASAGLVVLGRVTELDGMDLRLLGMLLTRNGEVVASGAGGAVLGDPLAAVAWLANRLSGFGAMLRAGDLVMAGALHQALPVTAGDHVSAEFARLGTVSTQFEEELS